ncbi:hypothetical protein GJ496_011395 [Pomphorhynchus laevis]|nr:hypothetical protein GJ496_011395 [Pomphorhynchus laevis]
MTSSSKPGDYVDQQKNPSILSTGTIAGICVTAIILAVLIIIICMYVLKRKGQKDFTINLTTQRSLDEAQFPERYSTDIERESLFAFPEFDFDSKKPLNK